MKKGKFFRLITGPILIGFSSSSIAEIDIDFDVSAFASVGVAVTNAVNIDFYDPIYKSKTSIVPEIAEVGQNPVLNSDTLGGFGFTTTFNDTIIFGIELLSEGVNLYQVNTDWLYVKWLIDENWNISVGRMRLPFYLYSEFYKIRYDYLWTRAPFEIYQFNPFTNFEGVELRYRSNLPFGWRTNDMVSVGNTNFFYEYGPYSWPVSLDRAVVTNFTLSNDHIKLNAGYTAGALAVAPDTILTTYKNALLNPCAAFNPLVPVVMTETTGPLPGTCYMGINSPLPVPPGFNIAAPDQGTASLFKVKNSNIQLLTFGYELEWNHIVSVGEWNRTVNDDILIGDSQAWYVTLGFNWDHLTPYVTYSDYRTFHNDERRVENTVSGTFVNPYSYFSPLNPIPTPETFQTSINTFLELGHRAQSTIDAGIRYDIVRNTALKFDYRYVIPREGTAGLFNYAPGKRISWVTAAINVIY